MSPGWRNDLGPVLDLAGQWEVQIGAAPPRPIQLPAAWDRLGVDPASDGPAVYRRRCHLPHDWLRPDRRVCFEADAVAFFSRLRVNGREAGAHRGQWSAFQFDITALVQPGENALELEVWKPGARFPVRETLAGFIPDLAAPFGGPWQPMRLRSLPHAALHTLRTQTNAHGDVAVSGQVAAWAGPAPVMMTAQVFAEGDVVLAEAHGPVSHDGAFALALRVPGALLWQAGQENRPYVLRLAAHGDGAPLAVHQRRIAFRDLTLSGAQIVLNGRPIHLRGVLDWGWSPAERAPRGFDWRAQFQQARAFGFNLWKACLFVPGPDFFETADMTGQMVWLEMPLWLPRVTPELKALARREYAALFEQLHHHPSLAVLSLGCELNAEADAGFLSELHALARHWLPDVLLCDNSGSAEAYGGVETALSDFYDYHFYADPHFFEPLIQHFTRGYRPAKPWLYGEFCDADTLRDFDALPADAWWLSAGTTAHADYAHLRAARERLSEAGVCDGGRALTAIGRRQAAAVRRFILELVRRQGASGGYVLTAWNDTPLATTGIVDDALRPKFVPEEWRRFNADRVLALDRERRRRWAGGDRPAPRDPHVLWQGERAEFQVLLSNGGEALAPLPLIWSLVTADGHVLVEGEQMASAAPGGGVHLLGALPISAPAAPGVSALRLTARLGPVENDWPLWAIPRLETEALLADPRLIRAWTPEAELRVRAGARLVWWLDGPDPRFTVSLPFWREAIHVFEPHALWEQVPHAGHADLRFFSLATDEALDLERLAVGLPADGRPPAPLWRRFDARQYRWHAYLVEAALGAGRLFITTLRFAGGLGAQPVTLAHNPMGAWLLAQLLNGTSI